MPVQIDTRTIDGLTVVDASGQMMVGNEGETLSQRVKKLAAEGKSKFIVSFSGLTFIDSWGVGELVSSFSTAKKAGGTLKLAGATGHVAEVLRIVRVTTIIEPFDTVEAAAKSFG